MDLIAARWVALTCAAVRCWAQTVLAVYGQLGLDGKVGGTPFFPSATQTFGIFFQFIGQRRCSEHEWLSLLMDSVSQSSEVWPSGSYTLGTSGLEHQFHFGGHDRSSFSLSSFHYWLIFSWFSPRVQIKWGKRDLMITASFTRNNLQTDFTPQHSARLLLSDQILLKKDLSGTNPLKLNQFLKKTASQVFWSNICLSYQQKSCELLLWQCFRG